MRARPELLVGIDLGTTGTKTALYEPDGTIRASATAKVALRRPRPGEVEQDPDDFERSALETVGECVRAAGVAGGDVAAIGVTGQMAGTLGIGANWRPTTPYDSWLDLRCSPDVEALERQVGDELVALAGCPAMINHAAKIRWWRRERPDEFAATAAFMPPSSYVAGRLAGLDSSQAFIDTSYLHFTGLAEARQGRWSELLARAVGVPLSKLPRIVEPATVIGELSAAAARECGLTPGVPIAAGLGDTAAGVLGAGIVRPGQLLDTAGTASVLAIATADYRPDEKERTLIAMRGAIEGQWVSLSYMAGGGLLDWVAGLLDGDSRGHSDGDGATADYETLGAAAEQAPPGADRLVFVPHVNGRLLPSQPQLRGAWVGLDGRHSREHLIRAVLESVAYEYSLYMRAMRQLHPELAPLEVRVIGGGARSRTWCRIKASVLGLRYVRLDREELSCWGAALVAGSATGLLPDLAAAAEGATALRGRFDPDAEAAPVYQRMVAIYEQALSAVAGPSAALAREED